jgi:hypothetical protein
LIHLWDGSAGFYIAIERNIGVAAAATTAAAAAAAAAAAGFYIAIERNIDVKKLVGIKGGSQSDTHGSSRFRFMSACDTKEPHWQDTPIHLHGSSTVTIVLERIVMPVAVQPSQWQPAAVLEAAEGGMKSIAAAVQWGGCRSFQQQQQQCEWGLSSMPPSVSHSMRCLSSVGAAMRLPSVQSIPQPCVLCRAMLCHVDTDVLGCAVLCHALLSQMSLMQSQAGCRIFYWALGHTLHLPSSAARL